MVTAGQGGGAGIEASTYSAAITAARAPHILVIKLGALGDFIHAFHAFAAIRARHAESSITLLTTAPYAAMAQAAPWFDSVILDQRASWWNLWAIGRTVRAIRQFDFVYDLQTSRRSNRYFKLAGRPPWSGIATGCSHPHANPRRDFMHTIERQHEQLLVAGVTHWPWPERDWLTQRGSRHGLATPYALLIPGGAGLGAVKRWPPERYGEIARRLFARGVTPVLIGGPQETALASAIAAACPAVIDLTGKTTLADVAALGAGASLAIGNDTGPSHLACSAGAPTIVLFSAAGVPEQAAPRGPCGEWATVLQRPSLNELTVDEVMDAADTIITATPGALAASPLPPPGHTPAEESTIPQSASR